MPISPPPNIATRAITQMSRLELSTTRHRTAARMSRRRDLRALPRRRRAGFVGGSPPSRYNPPLQRPPSALTIEFHLSQFSSMGRLSPLQRKAETDLLAGEEAHAVQGLGRGPSVLRGFRPGGGGVSTAEIAARTGLSRPTVSRLTQTLTALGYLAYVPRLGRYTLGAAIASLCHSLLSGMPYR